MIAVTKAFMEKIEKRRQQKKVTKKKRPSKGEPEEKSDEDDAKTPEDVLPGPAETPQPEPEKVGGWWFH